MLNQLKLDLKKLANPEKAVVLARFFKTGKGQYGEGDNFLGIVVPEQRKLAKKYLDLPLEEIQELLNSKIHEYRLTVLFILIHKYQKASLDEKEIIFNFYLKNTKNINNWDLVDLSAPNIVGQYLLDKDKSILYQLSESQNLWEKRIAILSTYTFTRANQFDDTLRISQILIKDKHDLIHKAVGWMLRELGKRNLPLLEDFLLKHKNKMPRTMLRYAIEKFEPQKRSFYMA